LGIEISDSGVERITTDRNHIALIDGYAIGVSSRRLVAALESRDDAVLSRLHGNYCVLIIRPNGDMRGFCDRFGAKSLYWQTSQRHGIIIASRWHCMPVFKRDWDRLGLAETLRYRRTSGHRTMVAGISKLSNWHRVSFTRNGEVITCDTAQQPQWPTKFQAVSFGEKLDETRRALTGALGEVAQTYDKAAIFLSGGVDSSLLAALCRPCFKECLLVTPVFRGYFNPELESARSFSEALQMEHLLVDIDPEKLETDLRELTRDKGGQIHFHSLAMHQMIAAIPEEFEILIHGEMADTLFGSGDHRRTESLLRWKPIAELLPTVGWEWISKLPIERVKELCRLMQSSTLDIALQEFQIQYDALSKEIICDLYNVQLDELHASKAACRHLSERNHSLRELSIDINLKDYAASEIRDIDVSATRFGKKVFMPFLADPVVNAAKTLTREQCFRNGYLKPVLRELACEHYERKLIFAKKLGFEVPIVSWLKGPLRHLVAAARQERQLYDGKLLSDLDVEDHHSLFWTLISWQLVNDQMTDKQKERCPPGDEPEVRALLNDDDDVSLLGCSSKP